MTIPRGVWQLGLVGLIVGALVIGIPALVWGPGYLRHREEERVALSGLPATAVVLALEDTGNRFNATPEIIVRLEVTAAGLPPWEAQVHRILGPLQAPAFVPGSRLDVRYDPLQPQSIAIVTR